ncbi:N-acetylmuramoyl-L-alanine amidase family protein [Velocimicrobium porci]|uniref:N-acetylmuramoyl-L-alanine amidase n=1 Tax=Velocimicrobium porci TaxID=2606634 RepID=A0A6L5XYR6_9FIRM|nr:N-acetylmuramoyl-L-alanine amidase [Velocimicrobium porci]MSS63348.1 N-acetylmuramoyl-L-alanine amidase [Velocimicrobium porci]
MAYKVTVDAGHGGFDNGASYNGRKEKDDTLRLALLVGQILAENGIDVNYTRTTDRYQSPSRKAEIGNENNSDLFVSIHRNAAYEPNAYHGVQTLIYDRGGIKEELANNINKELENVGYQNLGVEERRNLAVLRQTNMPAVLVEAGFIDSDIDNKLFDEKFYETANAIARGIIRTVMNQQT